MVEPRTTPGFDAVAASDAAVPAIPVDIDAGCHKAKSRVQALLGDVRQELGLREGERLATLAPLLLPYPVLVLGAVRAGLAWVNGRQMPSQDRIAQPAVDGRTAVSTALP